MVDWYNAKICEDKISEFKEKFTFSYDSIFSVLHGSFEDFCLACNVLANYGHMSEEMRDKLSFNEYKCLVEYANKIARGRVGEDFSVLFDGIVQKSRQELWIGDEFYKLFAYDIPPYYVMSCVKASLYVMDMMKRPGGVDRVLEISSMVCYPPYWELYKEDLLEQDFDKRNKIREKECNGWRRVAEYLYNKKLEEAYEFIHECDEA